MIKKLNTINSNIIQFDKNEEIRSKLIRDHLSELRDEEESYFSQRSKQISQILSMLKSIHIWNG